MSIEVNKQNIATDSEGFLIDRTQWSEQVALQIAEKHSMQLSETQMAILKLVRKHLTNKAYRLSMRRLVALIATHLNREQANSLYLMQNFGTSPAKMIAKLAGLPKPKNCL